MKDGTLPPGLPGRLTPRLAWGAPQPWAGRPLLATPAHPVLQCAVNRALFTGLALVLFTCGLAAGNLAGESWSDAREKVMPSVPLEYAVMQKLGSELKLSEAQNRQVAPIVQASCADLQLQAEEQKARRLEVLDEATATISRELSAEQLRRLAALQADWQRGRPARAYARIVALY